MKIDITRAAWRKSSYSQGGGQQCVEVAVSLPNVVAVRDSKNPLAGHHVVSPRAWSAFLEAVREGRL